mmetsp:Transcript_1809/g.3949  ORF Transcript_1809/g.3949 Transcript_1809/m.3949 type:complete len:91 (+) Transcript_1809:113-385(+)
MFSSLATKFLTRSSSTTTAAFRRNFHASSSCWEKLNVEGLAKKVDLEGKNVLVRVDLNVPLAKVRACSALCLSVLLKLLVVGLDFFTSDG